MQAAQTQLSKVRSSRNVQGSTIAQMLQSGQLWKLFFCLVLFSLLSLHEEWISSGIWRLQLFERLQPVPVAIVKSLLVSHCQHFSMHFAKLLSSWCFSSGRILARACLARHMTSEGLQSWILCFGNCVLSMRLSRISWLFGTRHQSWHVGQPMRRARCSTLLSETIWFAIDDHGQVGTSAIDGKKFILHCSNIVVTFCSVNTWKSGETEWFIFLPAVLCAQWTSQSMSQIRSQPRTLPDSDAFSDYHGSLTIAGRGAVIRIDGTGLSRTVDAWHCCHKLSIIRS